jgi:hypothetical protein
MAQDNRTAKKQKEKLCSKRNCREEKETTVKKTSGTPDSSSKR